MRYLVDDGARGETMTTPNNPTVEERNRHRIKKLIRTAHEVRPGEGKLIESTRSSAVQDTLQDSAIEDRVLVKQSAERMDGIPKTHAYELMAAIGALLGDVLGDDTDDHQALADYVRNRQRRRIKAQRKTERNAQIVQDARNAGH
jgi:hypothetical protein